MKKPKIGIITQARISSSRLPRKVLLPLKGHSILEYHLKRLQQTNCPLFVATTAENGSEEIRQIANQCSAEVFVGPLDDVLTRFYGCAKTHSLDYIVRVTSDCPLIDASLITQGIEMLLKSDAPENTYLSNTIARTYPRGFDFEIFSFSLLEKAHLNGLSLPEREHVTPYLYSQKDPQILIKQLKQAEDQSDLRVTLDTPEDWNLIAALIEQYNAETLGHGQISELLRSHEDLRKLNAHIQQKSI